MHFEEVGWGGKMSYFYKLSFLGKGRRDFLSSKDLNSTAIANEISIPRVIRNRQNGWWYTGGERGLSTP